MKKLIAVVLIGFSLWVHASEMPKRPETRIVVVHHSESEGGNAEVFRAYHVGTRGWADIGYHYVITNGNGGPNGEVQAGRREDLQGAHAANSGPNRNSHSVGVCLVGKSNFTIAQRKALVVKLTELCRKYKIAPSEATIQGHHDRCPGQGLNLREVMAWGVSPSPT